jgi:diguanylate cyclase (GGDEF)-like protein
LYDDAGQAARVVGVTVDITERKHAQIQSRAFTDTLEEAVKQRTQELEAENEARREALEALREANEQLWALATTDGLTGIGNRRAFNERLELEWASARRYSRPLALITLDVDHFKQYNDHFGHGAGDECLKRVAKVMGDERRATDLPARVGGEEFSVLLPDTNLVGALVVAKGIRSRLRALRINHPETPKGFVTASLGVAVAIPNFTIAAEDLLQAADQALYEAKRSGRDKVVSVAPLSGRHHNVTTNPTPAPQIPALGEPSGILARPIRVRG